MAAKSSEGFRLSTTMTLQNLLSNWFGSKELEDRVEVLKVQNHFWFGNLALRFPDESESAATENIHFFRLMYNHQVN